MSATENRPAEAPAVAEPTSSPAGTLKTMAQGFSSLVDVKKLLADVTDTGVRARFFFGKRLGGYRRHIYIVAKSESEMEEAKEFLTKWYKANPPPPRPRKTARGANGAQTADGTPAENEPAAEGQPEAVPETPVTAETAKSKSEAEEQPFEPKITFTDIPAYARTRSTSKKSSHASSSAAESAPGAESTEQPSGQRAPRQKRQRAKRNDQKVSTEASTEASKESTEASTTTDSAASTPAKASSAASSQKPAEKPARRPRVPMKFVAQPGRVAVKLPNDTTVEELRALLPDFPSTEIILKHQNARTTFHSGRRIRLSEVTIGLIDVGDENQAKAIEALKGKEVRGTVLDPKPGRSRVRDDSPSEKDEAATENQPQVEHVESKEA